MRVVRTFAFLDLCGFTSFTDEHGDNEAVAVLAQLRAALRAEAESYGVRVTKWLGDGAMLSGVEAQGVIACSVALRDDMIPQIPLALRGGICEGAVIMFEGDDYIGAAVNCAARLCDLASPGQMLVEGDTARRVPEYLELHGERALALAGFSREITAHEVHRRGGVGAAAAQLPRLP